MFLLKISIFIFHFYYFLGISCFLGSFGYLYEIFKYILFIHSDNNNKLNNV